MIDGKGYIKIAKIAMIPKLWIVETLALGSWPRQGFARLQAKKEARKSHLVLLGVQKNVRAWTLTLPFWEFGVPNGFLNFQSTIARVKTNPFEELFISLEIYWNLDV
jgi:hypothetical protein